MTMLYHAVIVGDAYKLLCWESSLDLKVLCKTLHKAYKLSRI